MQYERNQFQPLLLHGRQKVKLNAYLKMDDLTKKLFSRINESNKKINDLKSSLQMQKNAQMYKIEELKKKKKTIVEALSLIHI